MPWKGETVEESRQKYRNWYHSNPENRIHAVEKNKRNRHKVAEWLENYKRGLSCKCGENHPACISFHHEGGKDFNIGGAARKGYSISRILSEIKKCIVMCENCHRKLHYEENHIRAPVV